MYTGALIAFLHHLAAFTLTASIVYELVTFRADVSLAEARRLQKLDILYGISAGAVLVAGLLRVLFFEKGGEYYTHNIFFFTKMAAFLLVGLFSIYPTIKFVSWNASLRKNQPPDIPPDEARHIKLLLVLEAIGIGVILLSAVLMARGFGIF
jgi:putative membrane protein